MSRSEEIRRKLQDANDKLRTRLEDVKYWQEVVRLLTNELREAAEQDVRDARNSLGEAA